jgi:hypothetical protein
MTNTASGIEPAYIVQEDGDGRWKVYKVDLDTMSVLAKHVVSGGRCDCEGWKHNMKCRHLQMVFTLYPTTDRKTARKAASEVIRSWEEKFNRILFDDYVFVDAEEEVIRTIHLKAKGEPISLEGKIFKRLFAVRRGVFIEVSIE